MRGDREFPNAGKGEHDHARVMVGFINEAARKLPEPCVGDDGWRVRLAEALAKALQGKGETLGEFAPNDFNYSGGGWMPTMEIVTDSELFRDGIVRFSAPKPEHDDPDLIEKVAQVAAKHLTALSELRPVIKKQLEGVREKIISETSDCGAFCIRDIVFEEIRIVPESEMRGGEPDIILYADVDYDFGLCDNAMKRDSCPVKVTLGGSPNLSILHKRLGRSGCPSGGHCDKACHL